MRSGQQQQELEAGGTDSRRRRNDLVSGADESSTMDTSVKGHKVITGGGVDSYALTLPVILECGKGLKR